MTASPWAKRFVSLGDSAIVSRTRSKPDAVSGLDAMTAGVAANALHYALETIFVPTRQCIRIIRRIIDAAEAYSHENFPDIETFMRRLYDPQQPIPRPAICLTGLAGCGKSALLKALRRLIPDGDCVAGTNHRLPLRSFLHLAVKGHDREGAMLRSLVEMMRKADDQASATTALASNTAGERVQRVGSITAILQTAHRLAFRDGVAALLLDELQFLTQGGATTRITKTLLLHTYIGPPLVYSANFDMVHRLKNRGQQDTDRLLSRPIVLVPDALTCADERKEWMAYLSELLRVSNGALVFDLEAHAEILHQYSFGLRRKLLDLIEFAYGYARESGRAFATMPDFEWAYKSNHYYTHRVDIEALISIELGQRCNRKDLVSPFEIDPRTARARREYFTNQTMERVAEQAVVASFNPEEAKTYAEAGGTVSTGKSNKGQTPTIRVKAPVTPASLRSGSRRFNKTD
jgi:hypothetical protein